MIAALFVIAVGLQSTLAACPTPSVQQNFNVSAYLGLWHEQERSPVIFESGNCITAQYTLNDQGTVNVFNRQVVDGKPSTIEGTAKVASTTGEAKLEVTFNVPITVTAPYWVLSTDYTTYTIVWACQDLFGAPLSTMWILSREQNPPESLIENAYKIIEQKGLSPKVLNKTDQKNCN